MKTKIIINNYDNNKKKEHHMNIRKFAHQSTDSPQILWRLYGVNKVRGI